MDKPEGEESFLLFGQPCIGAEEIEEVVACLRSGWIGRGPRVSRFEEQFAVYKGVPEAVALQSCSSALLLALRAGGVGPGDEVITSPMTYCATINAIIHAGARPVLADIDPDTLNLDPRCVAAQLSSRTRALIPVHFAGRPCEMDPLLEIAHRRGLIVVEDCAHAIETEYKNQKAGTIGDFGCFSFYPTKNVTAGEGGTVLAKQAEHLKSIRILAAQGMTVDAWKRFSGSGNPHYSVVAAGFKYNMTDLEASIGIHQLARVEQNWRRRQAIWLQYHEALRDLPVVMPAPPAPGTRHACHLFPIQIDPREARIDRDGFLVEMKKRRIGCAIHYRSATEQPYYQQAFGWRPEDCPVALRTGRRTLSLPLSPDYSGREVERVVNAARAILKNVHLPAARGISVP